MEELTKAFDDGKQVDMIVLDFSKAFDTVPHKRLLQKLNNYGIRDIGQQRLLSWFENWLCGRTQEVALDGQSSEKCMVLSGVPQGTVLGPLCFLAFINDIGNELSPETKLKLFADDSLLFRIIESETDAESLQSDLDSLFSWTHTWHMKFHPSKCLVMSVTKKKTPISFQYKIQQEKLNHVDTITYLGVQISNGLQWKQHVEYVVAKASRTLGFLRRNLHQCPPHIKAQAYISLVRPILEYASPAWDPHNEGEVKALEKVQRTAARFVTNCWSREPGCVTKAMKRLGWATLKSRREKARIKAFHTATTIGHVIKVPAHIRKAGDRYATRTNNPRKFVVPFSRTNTYKYSFFPRTIREWNRLPDDLVDTENGISFRRMLDIYWR